MATFDETTARSNAEEIAAFFRAREILSGCAALQTLLEAPEDATTSKSLIVVGSTEPPWNGESYTVDQLENRVAWCQMFPKLDDGSFLVTWSKAEGATPEKEGFFRLHVRRQVRRDEYEEGRNNAWLNFWYLSSWMCEQYIEATDFNLRNKQIKRVMGPLFNLPHQPNWPEFGYFLYSDFLIPWGGSENDQ